MPVLAGYERVVAAAREGRVLVCVEQSLGAEFTGETARYFTGDPRCVVSAHLAVGIKPYSADMVVVACERRKDVVGRILRVTAYAVEVGGRSDWTACVDFSLQYLDGYMPRGSLLVPLGKRVVTLH